MIKRLTTKEQRKKLRDKNKLEKLIKLLVDKGIIRKEELDG